MKKDSTIIITFPQSCPECGQILPADSPSGLCSRCLLARALAGPEGGAADAGAAANAGPAARIGYYEIQDIIAQGGMGIVYRARDTRLGRLVALKMITSGHLATPAEVGRFKVEAEAAARLEHPNIVPIYEIGEQEGRHFFTMKLVSRGSLAQVVAPGPLPAIRAARLVSKLARAVHYAHQRGVLHRDIKPNNVLLDENDEPQLTDFGLAKIAENNTELTRSVAVMGSASFMAPEQALGQSRQVTTAADIYSLGAVLYQTLTGRPPFEGQTMVETLRRVVENEPIAPRVLHSATPQDLETICLKCLEKDPGRRYATALELAEDLERFLRQEPILARPVSSRERVIKWVKRKPAIAALAGTVVAVAVLGFTAVLWQLHKTREALHQVRQSALAEATAHAAVIRPRFVLRHETSATPRPIVQFGKGAIWVEEERHDTSATPRPIVSACYSPDGRRILTASQDGTAVLWDAVTGQPVRKFAGHGGVLAAAVFSADGRRVLTWSFDSKTHYATIDPAGFHRTGETSYQYGDQTARLWDTETGATITIITNPNAQISSAALSPDGKLIATAGLDNIAQLWDATTGRHIESFTGHTAAILSVQFSPDGRRLLTTSEGWTHQLTFFKVPSGSPGGGSSGSSSTAYEKQIARIWDITTGKQVGSLQNQVQSGLFKRYTDSRTLARFSPDGRSIVTAPADLDNLGIWDAQSGALRVRLRGHQYEINDAVFSPDGTRLVTASADTTARLWDVGTGEELAVLTAHEAPVLGADFSPDGKRFATASGDGTVRIWESATGKGLDLMKDHTGKVYSVHFSPDGARIVTAGEDGTARVWDAATLEQLSITLGGNPGEVRSIAFSRDSRRVLTVADGHHSARVWDVATRLPVSELKGLDDLGHSPARDVILGDINSAAFSPDGRFVAIVSDDQDAVVLSRSSRVPLITPATWPPAQGKLVPFTPGRIFDAETGRELHGLNGDGCDMSLVAWSADGRRVLTVSDGRQAREAVWPEGGNTFYSSSSKQGPLDVHLWDAQSGALLATLPGHTNTVTAAMFSPDSQRIVTGDHDRLRLWDAGTGSLITVITNPAAQIGSIPFSPDSRRLLGFEVNTSWTVLCAVIWDVATGREVLRFNEPGSMDVAVFSPDGSKVLLANLEGACALCDAATGQRLLGFSAKGRVRRLCFSPDGSLVAVLDESRAVHIWNVAGNQTSARLVATIDSHKDTVLDAAFSPDGKWLGTASKDFTARLWPVSVLVAGPAPEAGN